jgi:hypothetical protein
LEKPIVTGPSAAAGASPLLSAAGSAGSAGASDAVAGADSSAGADVSGSAPVTGFSEHATRITATSNTAITTVKIFFIFLLLVVFLNILQMGRPIWQAGSCDGQKAFCHAF